MLPTVKLQKNYRHHDSTEVTCNSEYASSTTNAIRCRLRSAGKYQTSGRTYATFDNYVWCVCRMPRCC